MSLSQNMLSRRGGIGLYIYIYDLNQETFVQLDTFASVSPYCVFSVNKSKSKINDGQPNQILNTY